MSFADRRGISVSQVLSEYTAHELNYWRAWDRREISQGTRIEHLLAQLLSAFYNANSKKKHNPNDFLFQSNWRTEEQTDAHIITNEINKALGK